MFKQMKLVLGLILLVSVFTMTLKETNDMTLSESRVRDDEEENAEKAVAGDKSSSSSSSSTASAAKKKKKRR